MSKTRIIMILFFVVAGAILVLTLLREWPPLKPITEPIFNFASEAKTYLSEPDKIATAIGLGGITTTLGGIAANFNKQKNEALTQATQIKESMGSQITSLNGEKDKYLAQAKTALDEKDKIQAEINEMKVTYTDIDKTIAQKDSQLEALREQINIQNAMIKSLTPVEKITVG